MNRDVRITLTDNVMSAMMKLSESNPGAMTAMMDMIEKGEQIDPQSFMGGLGALLSLDTLNIYGTDIYVLWSDICNKNTAHTLAVLRAVQLGIFSGPTLQDACSRQDFSGREMVPVVELYDKVRERLEEFDRQTEVEVENEEEAS